MMTEKGHCWIENCVFYAAGSNGSLNNCKKTSGIYLHSFGCGSFSEDPQDLADYEDPTN